MSEFTTAYDIRITRIGSYFSQTCEEYDHGSIRAYSALLEKNV